MLPLNLQLILPLSLVLALPLSLPLTLPLGLPLILPLNLPFTMSRPASASLTLILNFTAGIAHLPTHGRVCLLRLLRR